MRAGLAGLVALSFALLAVGVGALHFGVLNPSYASVAARYAAPPSRFMWVGSTRVHLRDEGEGPAVVLLHSSMTNLREWDAWTTVLKKHHRVIRLDWPPYGLSIDPGPFSMLHAEGLIERLVDQMKLDRFTLIGSSSGATISVLYAARHPERVEALALSSLPLAAPPASRTDPRLSVLGWAHRWFFPDYLPPIYYRALLEQTFADPHRITPAMIDWMFASNNIPGAQRHQAEYLRADLQSIWRSTGHGDAERVTAPVLLQWGDADPVLPPYLAEDARARLSHAAVTVIHYPNAGHYPMLEIPDVSSADLEHFLASLRADAAP